MDPGAHGSEHQDRRSLSHPRQLVRADVFEQTIQSRYIGTKRFSLEGNAALIPLLDEILNRAADWARNRRCLAMSHRGRLNVMVNIVGTPAAEVFARFEDVDPRSVLGGGDVKYHMGATGELHGRQWRKRRDTPGFKSQPSGSGRPGGMGRARAKQTRLARTELPEGPALLMHGDAAFAGQGMRRKL